MQFESLANELLLDLFEHLDIAYLIRAFNGLNSRFNQLLSIHLRTRQLSFQHLWKGDFDIICQQYLPSIVEQVISISLSNEETHGLTQLFLSHGFTIDQFIHLESLSLYDVHCTNTLVKITLQCRSLIHLTHLNIIKCGPHWKHYRDVASLFNNIWSLPKLTHCNLNTFWCVESTAQGMTTISTSIEHLSIQDSVVNMGLLSMLFKCTPRLQRLCIKVAFQSKYSNKSINVSSITSLKVSFDDSIDYMKEFFRNLPNLEHLTVMTSKIDLDGYAWQEIILKCLPKIKIFRLRMNFILPEDNYKQEQVKELFATFQTPFWIKRRHWFVQCYWDPTKLHNHVHPYISRFAFDTFGYSNKCCSKSTCLDETECWSDGRITIASNWSTENVPFTICNNSRVRFPPIRRLVTYQAIDENFLSSSPTLNKLTSLYVSLNASYSRAKLQTLLDQAPHLYTLGLFNYEKAYNELFQLQSAFIRRLDFIGSSHYNQEFFDNRDSSLFVNSPLASKCEVLLIRVENGAVVLNLIKNMFHLRSLNIHCKDDKWDSIQFILENDELVEWLQQHLPSSCSVIRHYEKKSIIQLWLGTLTEYTFSLNGGLIDPEKTEVQQRDF